MAAQRPCRQPGGEGFPVKVFFSKMSLYRGSWRGWSDSTVSPRAAVYSNNFFHNFAKLSLANIWFRSRYQVPRSSADAWVNGSWDLPSQLLLLGLMAPFSPVSNYFCYFHNFIIYSRRHHVVQSSTISLDQSQARKFLGQL